MSRDSLLAVSACAALLFTFTTAPASDKATEEGTVSEVEQTTTGTEKPGEDDEAGLGEVLGGASGVRVATMCTNCNIAGVTMSGQSDERVQVWKDGLPVMGGLGAIYLLSVMPSDGIANATVVNGAGSVLTGSEASAGALVLNTALPGKDPMLHGRFDVGSFDYTGQQFMTSGKVGRWGGGMILTRAKSKGTDANMDGNFDIGAFDRNTYGGTVTFDLARNSLIRFNALIYREDQRGSKGGYSGPARVDPGNFRAEDINIRRKEYGLGWEHKFRDASRLSLETRFSRRTQDTSDNGYLPYPFLMNFYMWVQEATEMAEARYERFLWQRHLLTVGAVYRKLDVEGENIKEHQYLQDFIEHQGFFAQTEFSLPHRLNLTVGARWDEYDWTPGPESDLPYPVTDPTVRSRVSPRTRLAWRATDELSLALSAGYGFAVPRPVLEKVCCGALMQSSAYSAAEVSRNFNLEADWVPLRWLRIKGSLFHNDFEDFLQKMAISAAPYYIPTFTTVNYTDFALEGITFSTEFRHFGKLTYGLEYTHLQTDSDEPIVVKRRRSEWRELPMEDIPFHPTDQGSAFINWEDHETGFEFSAQAQYTGTMYVQYLRNPVGAWRGDFAKTSSFWAVNLRTEKRLHRNLSFFAGVDNLTDEFQDWLDDPRYEYNWGLLRGRYVYGGIAIDM